MSFINPGLLFGLLAVAVPIIIFLMFRRKFKRIEWAAMEFLLRAQRRTNKRLKIENLLLLLLRCLVLALLALALARPKVNATNIQIQLGNSNHHILLVDSSYSMGYQFATIQNETFLARAQKEALAILENIYDEDEISIIRMDMHPELVVENKMGRDDHVIGKINDLELSHEGVDLAATLLKAQEVIESSNKQNQIIYLLTDFQLASFEKDMPGSAEEVEEDEERKSGIEIITKELSLMDNVSFHIIDVGDDSVSNRQVRSLTASRLKTLTGIETEFTVQLFNHSATLEQNYEIIFKVDGQERFRKTIEELPRRETVEAVFPYTFHQPGYHYISVEAADASKDFLALDDSRYLAVEVLPNIRVLAVNGEIGSGQNDETYYLRYAFPDGSSGEQGIIRADSLLDGDLDQASFADYDVVLMCNVGTLSHEVQLALEEFVKVQGKSVVWFMGDQVDMNYYNAKLYDNANGILPAKLSGREGDPQHLARHHWLKPKNFDHPILNYFKNFKGFVYEGFVHEYYGVEDYSFDPTIKTIIDYDNNDPALIEKPYGAGKSLLFTTTVDPEWNNLPNRKIFIPLMSEMIAYLAYRDRSDLNLPVRAKIIKEYPLEYSNTPHMFTPRSGEEKTDATMNATKTARYLVYPNTQSAGVYTLFAKRKKGFGDDDANDTEVSDDDLNIYFSVNLDPSEGNLERMTESMLHTIYPDFKFQYRKYNPQGSSVVNSEKDGNLRELWKYFAYAILALLLTESLLAWRFGRYKRNG